MRLLTPFLYLTACSYVANANETVPLNKSNEETLSAIRSTRTSLDKRSAVPPHRSNRNLSKLFSKGLNGAVDGGNNNNKRGVKGIKGKVARFLFNQQKNSLLNKMRKKTIETPRVTEEDEGDHYYGYEPQDLITMLDQTFGPIIDVTMTIDQSWYTDVTEGLLSAVGNFVTGPEEFCANFDVTTTKDDCVDALSVIVTFVEGAIRAPWLIRDITEYAYEVIREVMSWESIKGIVTEIMSLYGADGTVDGGLGAIRGVLVDIFSLMIAFDPYYGGSNHTNMGGYMFDILPQIVATDNLAYDDNGLLENFGDNIYEGVYFFVETIEYLLGERIMPDGLAFHTDICDTLGLEAANITTIVSCDYFADIGQEDLETKDVDFCVEPDQDEAELLIMESTFDSSTLEEEGYGWIIDSLQWNNEKFDNYDFSAIETMTCSIKGRMQASETIGDCNEDPLNSFLLPDGTEKTCRWLKRMGGTGTICEMLESARGACPLTCCLCEEDPKKRFFLRFKGDGEDKKTAMKSCNWLSSQKTKTRNRLCNKSWAPGGFPVAGEVCPTTCGVCE